MGARQAGLSASHELTARGVDHLILECDRIGAGCANRWNSFCPATPNWSVDLPNFAYDGDDPDGFMPRDEIVAHLKRYVSSFGAPVRTGVRIAAVRGGEGPGFEVDLQDETLRARSLVVLTGAFQKPFVRAGIASLPGDLPAMDISGYTRPEALPEGRILIGGSGQTGGQFAGQLHAAGREVMLSCGRAPWMRHRFGGKTCSGGC